MIRKRRACSMCFRSCKRWTIVPNQSTENTAYMVAKLIKKSIKSILHSNETKQILFVKGYHRSVFLMYFSLPGPWIVIHVVSVGPGACSLCFRACKGGLMVPINKQKRVYTVPKKQKTLNQYCIPMGTDPILLILLIPWKDTAELSVFKCIMKLGRGGLVLCVSRSAKVGGLMLRFTWVAFLETSVAGRQRDMQDPYNLNCNPLGRNEQD